MELPEGKDRSAKHGRKGKTVNKGGSESRQRRARAGRGRRRKPGLARFAGGLPRIRPRCPIATDCGACALIDLSPEDQARVRRRAIEELTAFSSQLAGVAIEPCAPGSPAWHYRTRARLVARLAEDGVRIGLFRRGTAEPVDLGPCLVHSAPVQRALEATRRWLSDGGLAWPAGLVIGVDLRETTDGGVHVTVVAARGGALPRDVVDALADHVEVLRGVGLVEGDPRSSYWADGAVRVLRGPGRIEVPAPDSVGGRLLVPVGGFFQAAPRALDPVHRRMRAHLAPAGGPLVDLYCGVGLHGLALAGPGEFLVGIETSASAVAAARENAGRLGVRAEFVAAPVERVVADLLAGHRLGAVVLNPPRAGCRPEVLEALSARPPGRAAYLSCNPFTLVRDLERLVDGGAVVTTIVPWDLLPQTDHVEVLALLEWPAVRPGPGRTR